MKKTHEELLKENVRLDQSSQHYSNIDKETRKEFARAFNWNKPRNQFDYGSKELYDPTWVEIFVELGKLLAAKTFYDLEGNVSELEMAVNDLSIKVNQPKSPANG